MFSSGLDRGQLDSNCCLLDDLELTLFWPDHYSEKDELMVWEVLLSTSARTDWWEIAVWHFFRLMIYLVRLCAACGLLSFEVEYVCIHFLPEFLYLTLASGWFILIQQCCPWIYTVVVSRLCLSLYHFLPFLINRLVGIPQLYLTLYYVVFHCGD